MEALFPRTDVVTGYIAGLIDGEGTITLMSRHRNETRSPKVTISSTTLAMLRFVQDHCGGQIKRQPHPHAQWKQAYEWFILYDSALALIAEVYPYLLEPEKRRRATLLLDSYKDVTPRNGKYSEEKRVERDAFEQEFFRNSSKVKLKGVATYLDRSPQ
jgi:hypothetical protein